jgi:hypothetical protein
MNFYGNTTGPQHTLFGRVVPMMGAMRLAIDRAAEQPLPAVPLAHDLPSWVHNIADELTCTVFKGIVNLAPKTKKFHARTHGQFIGLLLRAALFYWKDAPAALERDGLNKLTPERETKLDKLVGWEPACAHASQLAGWPITTKAQATKFFAARLKRFILHTTKATWTLMVHALNQPIEDVLQFLTGIPEGFKCFLRTDGEFAKRGKRTEIFIVLLTYWPEIQEMQQAQPPLSRPFLLKWLEEQEGKTLSDDKIFSGICDDISLDMAPPGHPFKRNDC